AFGGVDEGAIGRGLVNVRWPARFQRLTRGPLPDLLSPSCELWLDGGHNPAGGAALAGTLADLEDRSPRPLHLVVGMMGLKDAHGFLVHFRGLAKSVTAVPIPGAHEAPHAPETVAGAAAGVGIPAITAPSVAAALRGLQRTQPGTKRVLICGSLYLAGQVLALQEGVEAQSN
ncbi:MAG: bifunctional folylpolyglutamate synthase/dihydrofolate synthase, partial [Hyphomicrobiaceae bacterium]|nr:bifunctional folylpolyglutamate synthase/dihydrofolate synthase [Hyphomicrobiaceae bacterium]